MKKNTRYLLQSLFAFTVITILFSSCIKDTLKRTRTYTMYTPVYKERAVVLSSINSNASEAIDQAGKIYVKDNFIYLNEVNKGIHVIDNSNPASPQRVAFLSIPGNTDIAIKGHTLYADMYSDLVAVDITDIHNTKITSTISNFFPGRAQFYGQATNFNEMIVVDWIKKDTTVEINDYVTPPVPGTCNGCYFATLSSSADAIKSSSTGTAGSMAGMVLMKDHLYAITEMHSLGIVDITNETTPKLDTSFFAGFDLQTIFPFEDKLFLGSAIGMFMFDVSDPVHPVAVGEFSHGRACDPVITDGHYAYVTLHAGDGCGGSSNELNVIDVNDLKNSKLVKTYPLTKPTGLSKDGDLLFICDGTDVKVYNAANPADLQLLQKITSKDPYDVISGDKKAMVVCPDGLYQYDYSDVSNIRQLSFFSIKN
ncbi:MAG: hypothetical protein JWR61_3102 [Ferruginibacter sp.]|uniref:LVIVD repeat-containing protein n=1 Tax=Ferruginibacter sp. TaxID=1940288 RepID=UPI002658E27E|nr:hypothetical protein [Ferruginibacter sp.]MDB5278147.1 hypothetical protein [Ferruginibacter sp.]